MKVLLLASPFSNGGDFLIFDRAVALLKNTRGDVTVDTRFLNGETQGIAPEEINRYAAVVTGGGGAQFVEEYIRKSLVFNLIDDIKVPIHYMGTGMYGASGVDSAVYGIRYSSFIIDFFKKIIMRGGSVSCRDNVVAAVFKNNGISDVMLTGCPAWFDISKLNMTKVRMPIGNEIKKVVVSNQGITKDAKHHEAKAAQTISLIRFLKEKYPSASFAVTFNNGINTKYSSNYNIRVRDFAASRGMECVDLSYGYKNFSIIDDADIHVGFRVHSHIYSLSARIPSLLIEEDLRGHGINEILGLPHITAYRQEEAGQPGSFEPNPHMEKRVNDALDLLAVTDYIQIENAVRIMAAVYESGMRPWLNKVLFPAAACQSYKEETKSGLPKHSPI
jgi:hypothetical protein